MTFRRASFALLLLPSLLCAQRDPDRVHDPCIARDGEFYYVYSTGVGIPMRRSTDLIHWTRLGNVFAQLPDWSRTAVPGARDFWAPDLSFFNGRFHLYYAISTFGSIHSSIGHADNITLDPNDPRYHWNDHGKVIDSDKPSDFNAIDPNVFIDEPATPWLVFGSYWSGIKLAKLDANTGALADDRIISLAARPKEKAIEAPFIIHHGQWFYLFVSFDQCCKGAASTYKTMVGRSSALAGPYVDFHGRPMLDGAATTLLAGYDTIRGPGHCAILIDGEKTFLVHHFYDAADQGHARMQIRPLHWLSDNWPVAGEPLTAPTTQPHAERPGFAGAWRITLDFGEPKTITLDAQGKSPDLDASNCLLDEANGTFIGRSKDGAVIYGKRGGDF